MTEISKKLEKFLEEFENDCYLRWGLRKLSGGYTVARYKFETKKNIYFNMDWGIMYSETDIENHTEHYKISKSDFEKPIEIQEKIKMVRCPPKFLQWIFYKIETFPW
jgi:hypothetical protein